MTTRDFTQRLNVGSPAAALAPAEMAEVCGVSIDTLRYYEREGLIEPVERTPSGHRRYSPDDVAWVGVLRCLRDTGMTIEQLRRYCALAAQGVETEPERRQMLSQHRSRVEQKITEWTQALELIDHKLSFYGGPADIDPSPSPENTSTEKPDPQNTSPERGTS